MSGHGTLFLGLSGVSFNAYKCNLVPLAHNSKIHIVGSNTTKQSLCTHLHNIELSKCTKNTTHGPKDT